MKLWSLLCMTVCAAAVFTVRAQAAPPRGQSNRQELSIPGVELRTYETPYYYIHTDLPEEDAREAMIRTTRMFEAYRARTAELFKGQINQKLSFYLFARPQDYMAAGGMPGSAGVFDGTKLMAMAIRGRDGKVGMATWHVVQHEGFHQFVAYVIQGQIPTWVNEGIAEYFGEAMFTGDEMITGLIPAGRLKRVQAQIREGKFKTVKEMMFLSHDAWNAGLSGANYDQAWSMVQFLAAGDNGKYRDAFAQFLQIIGRGRAWDAAWATAFGSADGFEQRWKDYWLNLPPDPTLDLYAQADVLGLTSFLGRAYTQKQTFDDAREFLGTDVASLKAHPADWLPPQLFDEMKDMAKVLQTSRGVTYKLERLPQGGLPRLVCTMEGGTKIIGNFEMGFGGKIGRVYATVVPPSPSAAVKK